MIHGIAKSDPSCFPQKAHPPAHPEFKDMAVKLAKQQYDNAIDDFLNAIKTTDELIMSNCSIAVIESIAEQLKEGGTD